MNTPVLTALLGVAAFCWSVPLQAQAYPGKPLRIVVTAPPGGVLDTTTRAIAPKLTDALGQPVIVENRAGADGIIGTEFVARAAPDGYTLLAVFDNFPLTQHLYKSVPYDALKDFAPISLMIRGPQVLVVNASTGIKDMVQFMKFMKTKGDTANYSTAGVGSSSHLSVELFRSMSGIAPVAVHMKGGAQAMTELVAGRVDMMIVALGGNALTQIKAGKLVPLGVSSLKRHPMLPDVPAIADFYPGYEAQTWVGLAAPARTPNEIVRRLNAETVKALADRELKSRFEEQTYEVVGSTPEAFAAWITAQYERWGRVIRERKISLD